VTSDAAAWALTLDAGVVTTRGGLGEALSTVIHPAPREDEVLPRTGGPAGNARLTAWLGLALLVLFFVEGVTLLALHSMLGVHIVVGTVLVPLALAKTGSTGWRIVRYYAGSPTYRRGGPPPVALRILGPFIIATALAVLGTGIALIALGQRSSNTSFVSVAGVGISALALHKAAFIAWFAATTAHVLTRFVPAVTTVASRHAPSSLPGRSLRTGVVIVSLVTGLVAGLVVLDLSHAWTAQSLAGPDDRR
jgi:hypothetical protein